MIGIPLHSRLKKLKPETILAAICLTASITGAGFVFIGGNLSGGPVKEVKLIRDGISESHFTSARTVKAFFKEQHIRIDPHDTVIPSLQTLINTGMTIKYRPAVEILLADSGQKPLKVKTSAHSICELLDEREIKLDVFDRVEPAPSTPLEDGMKIEITRVQILDVTSESKIEPPLKLQPDTTLPRGRIEDINPGVPGIAEEVTRYYYKNGKVSSSIEIGSRILKKPVERVAKIGTRSYPTLASRGTPLARGTFVMVATAYDPGPESCAPYADGYTATGVKAGRGVCAVDPRVIPLGTRLWIEGYGEALACDTGGAIKGNRIDVCFDTRAEAIKWGRRSVVVHVIE